MLGYVVGGFGTGEANEQRRGMLAASLAPLPPAALRMVAGISTPHQVRPLQLPWTCCPEEGPCAVMCGHAMGAAVTLTTKWADVGCSTDIWVFAFSCHAQAPAKD